MVLRRRRVVGSHGDLAPGAVVDSIDGSVITDPEGNRKGFNPENKVLWDVALQRGHRQGTIFSSLLRKEFHG